MHWDLTGVQASQLLLKTSQSANFTLDEIAWWVGEEHESGLNRTWHNVHRIWDAAVLGSNRAGMSARPAWFGAGSGAPWRLSR